MSKTKKMILLEGMEQKAKSYSSAINGIWAMVRVKFCVPFVCDKDS